MLSAREVSLSQDYLCPHCSCELSVCVVLLYVPVIISIAEQLHHITVDRTDLSRAAAAEERENFLVLMMWNAFLS